MIRRLEGCENVIGFRKFIPRSVKRIVMGDDAEDGEDSEAIVYKIRSKQ